MLKGMMTSNKGSTAYNEMNSFKNFLFIHAYFVKATFYVINLFISQ